MPANAWTIDELEQALRAEIARCGAGELDGHGQCLETGELEIFTYGPDADTLASIVNEVVVRFPKGPGSYLVKRYGKTGAREERIELL